MRLIFFLALLATGVFIVFYLSWLPQPDLSKIWYMPLWLGRWTNAHDTLRTAVPFIFLGLLTGGWLAQSKRPWRWWLCTWLGLVTVVAIAEFGQLFLPHRVFDWRDIAWGVIGGITGLVAAFIASFLVKTLSPGLRGVNDGKRSQY